MRYLRIPLKLRSGVRLCSTVKPFISINQKEYPCDSYTNVTEKILNLTERKLYAQQHHPLCLIKEKIINFFYENFKNSRGNPIFSAVDDLDCVVTTFQNFDSLLIPKDHVSRKKSDCYYVNTNQLLRSHMTAHQFELMKMGLDNFLMVGDVYRRDEINSSHYPVFHQLDAVKLFSPQKLFLDDGQVQLQIKESNANAQCRTQARQEAYTLKASQLVEENLKRTLEELSKYLFGKGIQYRWVDAYFPFTHPSFELEILLKNKWTEVLGCGVMEQKILEKAGCGDRIGWAFGLGLERLAMILYEIPDIRIFWSTDPGFLHQFSGKTYLSKIKYREVSKYPACKNDISFWISDSFSSNDFYDLARDIGGDYVELIELFDVFKHPKSGKTSHAYRIHYRHMTKTLTQEEVNVIHKQIEEEATRRLKVKIR